MTTLQMFLLSVKEPIRNMFAHSCLIIFYSLFIVLYMYCFMAGYRQISFNISCYLDKTRLILTFVLRQLRLFYRQMRRSIYWMWMHLNMPSSLVSAIAIGSFIAFNTLLKNEMPALNMILIKPVERYSSVNLIRNMMQDNQIILATAIFTSIFFLSVACLKLVINFWTQYVFLTIRGILVIPLRHINPRIVHKHTTYSQGGTSRTNQEHFIQLSQSTSDNTLEIFCEDKTLHNATVKNNFENGEVFECFELKDTNNLQRKTVGATHSQSMKEIETDIATNMIIAENNIVEFLNSIEQVKDHGKQEQDFETREGVNKEKCKEIVNDEAMDLHFQNPTESEIFKDADVTNEVENAFALNDIISVKDKFKFGEKHNSDKDKEFTFEQQNMNAIEASESEEGFKTMEMSRNINAGKPEYKYARNRTSYKVTKGLNNLGNIYKPKFNQIKRCSSPLPKKRNAEPNAVKGLIKFYETSTKKKRFYCSGNSVNEIDLRFINAIY